MVTLIARPLLSNTTTILNFLDDDFGFFLAGFDFVLANFALDVM